MNSIEKTIVRKIEWFNNEDEMMMTCEIMNGALRYNSRIAISGSCLNKVLSELQKQTPDYDLNDCLKIEQWSEDEVSFTFDFTRFSEIDLVFERPSFQFDFRQIRA